MVEQQSFKVEITYSAKQRYQEEILSYLVDNFSFERALEIDENIALSVKSLSKMSERGRTEPNLEEYKTQFRFILHNIKYVYLPVFKMGPIFY